MCGRYILAEAAKIEKAMRLGRINWHFEVSYNVCPTQDVPVVRAAEGEREGVMMRWGLVPFWAGGVEPKYSTINATVERFETAPVYRGPWSRGQRCIVPTAGFYEWHLEADGRKQPFLIGLADQEVFGFAGLWDRSKTAEGQVIESFTIITMPANRLMTDIHNVKHRMPAILAVEDQDAWLSGKPDEAKAALRQYPDDLMVAHKVSTRVNSPKNNVVDLVAPID
jgi:putative SOS response-associated peptidase YedK